MGIRDKRIEYKPFEYEVFEKYLLRGSETMWRPLVVNMTSDIEDWELRTSKDEKDGLILVLPMFTQGEILVEDFWLTIPKKFPKPEIASAAAMHAAFEAIHMRSYQHLFDSLGLTDFKGFLKNDIIMKKLDYFSLQDNDKYTLARFTSCERISLFSIFAWLLSFRQTGRFKGIAQIVSWSARDEHTHGLMGTDLFNILVDEEGITEEERSNVIQIVKNVVLNELDFLDQLYNNKDFPSTIDKLSLIDYTKYRGNCLLKDYNIDIKDEELFLLTGDYQNLDWFEAEILGQVINDFFDNPINGGNYISNLSQDFNNFDYTHFKNYEKFKLSA